MAATMLIAVPTGIKIFSWCATLWGGKLNLNTAMLFGVGTARKVINEGLIKMLAALGVLLYGSVGIVSLLNGKNFLDYSVLAEDALDAQHYGIVAIELGVGITVAAVMMIIFFTFAGRVDLYHPTNK